MVQIRMMTKVKSQFCDGYQLTGNGALKLETISVHRCCSL